MAMLDANPPPSSCPVRHAAFGISCITMLLFQLLGCGSTADTPPAASCVIVLAAASTMEPIKEVAEQFEKQTGFCVRLSVGPSNGLARQIVAGAPADLFLSANRQWATFVTEAGLTRTSTELLSNAIVLVVPRGNPAAVHQPEDLLGSRTERVAIAGKNVPVGIYAKQALQQLDLFEPLDRQGKIARGSDARVTLAYVEQAEVEAGIIYATDATDASRVETVFAFDPQTYDQVVYPLLLLQMNKSNTAANEFYQFLQAKTSKAIFERYGFTTL
ncbi:Molybdate-binding periplasmic protein precursor [Novipirellula artificiosorum]|uniref:Molybdate-binding periplasmic protein n=2 Tax=Novipirellula artificiosorum TaxID=2528016 RepID=A0A5C6E3V2_9BACT|nr:Molybdate-binding periplasmic protein precursor [Novipirellula artificiosorum]